MSISYMKTKDNYVSKVVARIIFWAPNGVVFWVFLDLALRSSKRNNNTSFSNNYNILSH